ATFRREPDRFGIGHFSDIVGMVLLGVTCKGKQLLGSIGGFQPALPFIRCGSRFTEACPCCGEIHMLENWLERKPFPAQYLFHLVPAFERCESINVLQKKILALYRPIQRQQFQSLLGAANPVKPPCQRSESFIIWFAEAPDCVPNILIRERRIVLGAKLQCQQLETLAALAGWLNRVGRSKDFGIAASGS